MMLAGIAVADRHVIELARILRDAGCDETAARLESGYEHQAKLLALSVEERDEILSCSSTAPTASASCARCASSSTNGECGWG